MKFKKVVKAALAATLALGLAACGSSEESTSYRTLDEIKESGTIKIWCLL